MKMKQITILLITFFFLSGAFAVDLYVVSSKEMGIKNFNYTVEEIERQPSYSKLHIRNFNDRSAAASRWMLCAYTDLAIKRGFENWAIYYPKEVKDQLLIVFPQTKSKDDPIYKEMKLDSNIPMIASIYTFAQMCGMKLEK
jgi:hypothetical protein